MLSPSHNEPGNLRWDIWRDSTDPRRFVVEELYIDVDAVESHRKTPHYKKYAAAIQGAAERIAVTVEPVDVAWARRPRPVGMRRSTPL